MRLQNQKSNGIALPLSRDGSNQNETSQNSATLNNMGAISRTDFYSYYTSRLKNPTRKKPTYNSIASSKQLGKLITSDSYTITPNIQTIIEYDVPLNWMVQNHSETKQKNSGWFCFYTSSEMLKIFELETTDYIKELCKSYVEEVEGKLLLTNMRKSNTVQSLTSSVIDGKALPVHSDKFDYVIDDEMTELYAQYFSVSGEIPNKSIEVIRNHFRLSPIKKAYSTKTYKCNDKTAVEILLTLATMIKMVNYENGEYTRKYTRIASSRLKKVFGDKKYLVVKDVLLKGSKKFGGLIECDYDAVPKFLKTKDAGQCYGYRFTEQYFSKGLQKYEFKTELGKEIYLRSVYKQFSKAMTNTIARRAVQSYESIILPVEKDITAHYKTLTKAGYRDKKGRWYVSLNGKSLEKRTPQLLKKYSKLMPEGETPEFIFVEDHIKIFYRLTRCGFMVPIICGKNAGGRVVDSFNLMPSQIRGLCKMYDDKTTPQPVEQDDYVALHPNLNLHQLGTPEEVKAIGGDVHTNIARLFYKGIGESELSNPEFKAFRTEIKIENLSFANKPVNATRVKTGTFDKDGKQKYKWVSGMSDSMLWDYYWKVAPVMMLNLVKEKELHGYKITSQRLLTAEVKIMNEVIERLPENVDIMYVFDCLGGIDDIIHKTMNQVVYENNIPTYVGYTK